MGEQSANSDSPKAARTAFYDLGLRTASGITLAAIALSLTYYGNWGFTILVAAAGAAMSWEWGRIVRGSQLDAASVVHVAAVLMAAVLAASGQSLLACTVIAVGTAVVLIFTFSSHVLLSSIGVAYVGLPAVSLILLRDADSHGLASVMFVLLVVWTVDTGAFLGGRSIGGRKLWPSVSPNKTWAGFICGIAGGALIGMAVGLWIGAPVARLGLVALMLGIVAQGGDLAESALKRSFGVKDSSHLIPGHGGALDRLDGVVAAATLAGLIAHAANLAAPARALLYGA